MDMVLYDKNNICSLKSYGDKDFQITHAYIKALMEEPLSNAIKNGTGEYFLLLLNGKWLIPIFLPKYMEDSTYINSMFSHYVLYAGDELRELKSPFAEKMGKGAINVLKKVVSPKNMESIVFVNHWLTSTCIYSDFPEEAVGAINTFLEKKFKTSVICWNSINSYTTPKLYTKLRLEKTMFIKARSVYIQDDFEKITLDSKRDRALRNKTKLVIKKVEDSALCEKIAELYNMLYIEKYSSYNPQYTTMFFKTFMEQGILKYYGLFDGEEMLGVVATCVLNKVMTVPILGYNTKLSQKLGIYRLLSLQVQELAQEAGVTLHWSAGAGRFKRNRGGKNVWEYKALYFTEYAKNKEKRIYKGLVTIFDKVVAPMMEKRGL